MRDKWMCLRTGGCGPKNSRAQARERDTPLSRKHVKSKTGNSNVLITPKNRACIA